VSKWSPEFNITNKFWVSRQPVSRALLSMDKLIKESLLEMVSANKIEVEKLDSKEEILFGKSVPFKVYYNKKRRDYYLKINTLHPYTIEVEELRF
jgi:hypothetical protein